MTAPTEAATGPRIPLTRQRVLEAAVRIADETGIESLTMRRLGEAVGAEAMSLYYHVAKKEDVLDGIADVVAAEINEAADRVESADWKSTVRRRILAARAVMLRHPGAPAVFETRTTTSPAVLRYYDRLVGLLREGGFSNNLIHRALHALGSRALGFTQELFDPEAPASPDAATLIEQLPSLAGMMAEIAHDDPASTLGWCDAQAEFEFALDLLLDGLERARTTETTPGV